MYWEQLSRQEINQRVDEALAINQSYFKSPILGIPGTFLDQKEFYHDAPFLENAPYLKTLISNPNHIGCHTLSHQSSSIFKGTQAIEKELIKLCAEQIFKGEADKQDGYVATGGTEANIEALWIYRNYFKREYNADNEQIGVLFSKDTHYSIAKGCDLLQIQPYPIKVDEASREIEANDLERQLELAKTNGIRYFICIINVSTTMFGSVDKIEPICEAIERYEFLYKIHLDAAFGGFIYPFTHPDNTHNFSNSKVSSISIDGHKMLQTPYGTGLFLIRKGFMHYVTTEEAQYVPGLDYTICGSRSGSNAVVIWMILMNYGSEGWTRKMNSIIERTNFLCRELDELQIRYFRNPYLNIVTIDAMDLPDELGFKYELVADTYEHKPRWWKIVVMDHVDKEVIGAFLDELKSSILIKN